MNERVDDAVRLDPAIDRPDRISGAGRLIILAFGLVGVAIGFVLVEGEGMEPLMLGLLAMLAIVGVAMLLLLALGLIRVGGRKPGLDIARGYLDTLGEGVMHRRRRRAHPLRQSCLCGTDRGRERRRGPRRRAALRR